MGPARLEGFSDAVLAVIITIMVLELRPPSGAERCRPPVTDSRAADLRAELRIHRHLLEQPPPPVARDTRISGGVMWANLHLLFWLSLVPVVTAWVGDHPRDVWPAVIYGAIGFLAGIAYYILTLAIRKANKDTPINGLLQRDTKAKMSVAFIALGMAVAFIEPLVAYGVYALVSLMWFIPDRRLASSGNEQKG